MEPILYFAYGSNMLAQRLTARCSSARVHCIGAVAGYALAFSKKSKDGSGKATLIASKDRASSVQGVVFELARNELDELDRSEGRGKGYERIVKVRAAHGATLKAITYLITPVSPLLSFVGPRRSGDGAWVRR